MVSVKTIGVKSILWETVSLNGLFIFFYYPRFHFNTYHWDPNFFKIISFALKWSPSFQHTCQFNMSVQHKRATPFQSRQLAVQHKKNRQLNATKASVQQECVSSTRKKLLNWRICVEPACWTGAFDVLNWRILGAEKAWPLCSTEEVCVELRGTLLKNFVLEGRFQIFHRLLTQKCREFPRS